jgi:N-dimethylarginine dimethylaminohydrolase
MSLIPELDLSTLRPMPYPQAVLMCPPDYFEVIDVKNPFMQANIGAVDKTAARRNWDEVKDAFVRAGVEVKLIAPEVGREDMVFCANQTFTGLDASGDRVCVLSQMRHPSRQKEVPAFKRWFSEAGYRIETLDDADLTFEGGGDAVWHPGRALIWGGIGPRTQQRAYEPLAWLFDAPVLLLNLKTENFYHLDTCFCAIDETTVMIYPPAFDAAGLELIHNVFGRVIEVERNEAESAFACNASAFFGKTVVMQSGAPRVRGALETSGFQVIEVDTREFMKSGGSVYCMKMYLF